MHTQLNHGQKENLSFLGSKQSKDLKVNDSKGAGLPKDDSIQD